MKEKTIEVPNHGTFVLRKPKAGQRNKALIESGGLETENQRMRFLFAVMPHCVKSHPWDKKYRSVSEGLDDMEADEYDVLLEGLAEMLKPVEGETEKKSQPSSEQSESVPTMNSSRSSTSTNGAPRSEQGNPGKTST